jgi:hypothetical protein
VVFWTVLYYVTHVDHVNLQLGLLGHVSQGLSFAMVL